MPYNQHGSYLIRCSETYPDQYALSLRDGEVVKHYIIQQLEDGTYLLSKGSSFKTVVALVTHYQRLWHGLLIHHCIIPKQEDDNNQLQTGDPSQKWEIDRRYIGLTAKLHEGEFSDVWKGLLARTKQVAVKIHKYPKMNQLDFLRMASLMMKLHHPSIIQLYGFCTKNEPIYIVTEYSEYGSLLNVLQTKGRRRVLLSPDQMSKQVAEGMAYLEELNCIHRDVAARNIRLGQDLRCKVANFEMARMLGKSNTFEVHDEQRSTYKWTAPEAAIQKKYSIKSDVWSFGIVLYEIFTRGCPPYPGMTDDQMLMKVRYGYRMPQPQGCQKQLYDIILQCWEKEPMNRPTFRELATQLMRSNNNFDIVFTSEQIFADPATLLQ